MAAKFYKTTHRADKMVEAFKFLDWKSDDPSVFKNSRLVKYEKVKITKDLFNSIADVHIETCMSDRGKMMSVKNMMTEISEEEYNKIIEAAKIIIRTASDAIEALNDSQPKKDNNG